VVNDEPLDFGDGGGGAVGGGTLTVVKLCPTAPDTPEMATAYRITFSGGVEGPHSDIEPESDKQVDADSVEGQFDARCDNWEGYGQVDVANLGVPEGYSEPMPFTVTVNGTEIGTVQPDEAATVKDGELTNRRDASDSSGSPLSGDGSLGSGLPVPSLLPSLGPLSGKAVTILALLAAAGIVVNLTSGG
jgi:hypothetical protein